MSNEWRLFGCLRSNCFDDTVLQVWIRPVVWQISPMENPAYAFYERPTREPNMHAEYFCGTSDHLAIVQRTEIFTPLGDGTLSGCDKFSTVEETFSAKIGASLPTLLAFVHADRHTAFTRHHCSPPTSHVPICMYLYTALFPVFPTYKGFTIAEVF